jgi:hypothetical protein
MFHFNAQGSRLLDDLTKSEGISQIAWKPRPAWGDAIGLLPFTAQIGLKLIKRLGQIFRANFIQTVSQELIIQAQKPIKEKVTFNRGWPFSQKNSVTRQAQTSAGRGRGQDVIGMDRSTSYYGVGSDRNRFPQEELQFAQFIASQGRPGIVIAFKPNLGAF